MSRCILAGLLAALALTACDKPNHPEPERDLASLVTWDAASQKLMLGEQPVRVVKSWDLSQAPVGLELLNASAKVIPGQGLLVSGVAPDPGLRLPTDGLRGSEASLLVVRLTRVKATANWDGAVYYATGQHPESARFMSGPADSVAPPTGVPVVLVYDMEALRAGGDDWMKSMIKHIRLDLDDGAGGEVLIHQVALVWEPF